MARRRPSQMVGTKVPGEQVPGGSRPLPTPRPPAGTPVLSFDQVRKNPMPFDANSVPVGWVAFVSYFAAIPMLLGEGAVRPTAGYGGWEITERPGDVGVTDWEGVEPIQLPIPVLFDAYRFGFGIDAMVASLEAFARPPRHVLASGTEPPTIKVYGKGIPHRDLLWVMEDLEWGDLTEFNEYGDRVRQSFTVTLREFIDPLKLITLKRPKRKPSVNCAKAKSRKKRYKIRKGDTFPKISKRFLGDAKCWRRITKLNGVRDPKKIKDMVGKTIKLP